MKSTTSRSRTTAQLALFVALSVLVLLSAADIVGAQQQSALSVAASKPARDAWDYLSLIGAPLAALVAIVVAVITAGWSIRNWKWTYFTKEWSLLMQFIQPQARFMDPSLTADYKTRFTGEDAMKYEMIARLCIGYLDDLYFLGSKHKIRTWFPGSVRLFAGTHRSWLENHKDSYDKGFYEFILSELDRR